MHSISPLTIAFVVCALNPLYASGTLIHRSSSNQIQVEALALSGMPVRIDSAILENVDGKQLLRYSVTNLGDEQIKGIEMWFLSYSLDGISISQFSLGECKLAPASAADSTQEIDEDLSLGKRLFFLVHVAVSADHLWFLEPVPHSLQKELDGSVGFSMPDVNSFAVIKKPTRPVISSTKDFDGRSEPTADVDARPVQLNNPLPLYTEEARKVGVQGTVSLQVLVGADGEVKQVKVVSGLPDGLNEEAITCAYKFRFQPAMKNGQAVPCWQAVDVEFRMAQ